MVWFKMDDQLHSHPKWLATSLRARGLWASAGSWSSAQQTDGHVPAHVLQILGGKLRDAQELVDNGLWRENGNGWVFHNWDEWNPTKADIEADRANKATGGARGNHLRWHVKRGITDPECEFCQGAP